MTKFIVFNRTDTWKTDVHLFFYNDKLSNYYSLLLVAVSHKLSVRLLTMKISQWVHQKLCRCKICNWLLMVQSCIGGCIMNYMLGFNCLTMWWPNLRVIALLTFSVDSLIQFEYKSFSCTLVRPLVPAVWLLVRKSRDILVSKSKQKHSSCSCKLKA